MKKATILTLTVVNLVYVTLGGVMFALIESRHPQDSSVYRELTEAFLDNHTCVSAAALESLARQIVQLHKEGASLGNLTQPAWDYHNAMFFTVTAVTTIGYGHITPRTPLGQVVCVFYLIFGVPLMTIYLAGIGSNIRHLLKSKVNERMWIRNHRGLDAVVKLVSVNVSMLSLLIFIPAAGFACIENWTYRESVYYAVVSLSTVGFGDFFPDQGKRGEHYFLYKLLYGVWIVVGLAVVATVISDVRAYFTSEVFKQEKRCKMTTVSPVDSTKKIHEELHNGCIIDSTTSGI